jgi:hypothetical protein
VPPLAQDLRDPEQTFHPLLRRHALPLLERLIRQLHRFIGLLCARRLKHRNHLRRMRWVHRGHLCRREHLLPTDVHRIFFAEFRRYLLERCFHTSAVLWFAEIQKSLIRKLARVHFRFRGGHISLLFAIQNPILL